MDVGFTHAAFTFYSESMLDKSNLGQVDTPSGQLISYLQKGLLYREMEQHLNEVSLSISLSLSSRCDDGGGDESHGRLRTKRAGASFVSSYVRRMARRSHARRRSRSWRRTIATRQFACHRPKVRAPRSEARTDWHPSRGA